MVGVGGLELTVTTVIAEVAEQPEVLYAVTA
jgi:hypothetical protein